MKFIVTQKNNGYAETEPANGILYLNKDNKGADIGMVLDGVIKNRKFQARNRLFTGNFLQVKAKSDGIHTAPSYTYLPMNTVKPYRFTAHSAEGDSKPEPTPAVQKTGAMDTIKSVAMDKGVLTMGISFGLMGTLVGTLLGVSAKTVACIAGSAVVVGAVVGRGMGGDGFHSAEGKSKWGKKPKPVFTKKNVCHDKPCCKENPDAMTSGGFPCSSVS